MGRHLTRSLLLAALYLFSNPVTAKKDYYEVLGVDKKADDKAIKSAYRKMALKWHPDKNPDDRENAEIKFREVAEAYEVLSNPKTRKNYDEFGSADGGQGGRGFEGFGDFGFGGFKNPNDLFKEMFGNEDPFADFAKFFGDVEEESFGGDQEESVDKAAAQKEFEEALVKFYAVVGDAEKAKPEKVREILAMPKWKDKPDALHRALKKKYSNSEHQAALKAVEAAAEKLRPARGGGGGGGGFEFGDLGGLGNLFGGGGLESMFGGFGGGGGATMSFSSFSSSSGGKTVKKETVIQNGKRVTKTIESDGKETRASMEEEEGGRIKRKKGVKKHEQLDNTESDASRDEM